MERTWRAWAIGPYGYLVFFAWAIVLAALTDGPRLAVVSIIALFFWRVTGGRWQDLGRVQLWFLLVSSAVLSSILIGEKDIVLGRVAVSSAGLWIGLWMALRLIVVVMAVGVLTQSVSIATLARLFEGWGLGGLGFALGLSVNLLPTMRRTVEDTWSALRLRGGPRQERWRALRLFLVTVTVNALRHGDMLVEAAESRGFSATPRQGKTIGWQPGDLALTCVLAAASAMLLAV
jgi:energy-coupling factor transporter transmembrane protein EcfT